MRVEDIIEGLNRHLEDRRKMNNTLIKGHLVLQKVITPNPTFKAYKSYEAILWFVNGSKKYRIITVKDTDKVIEGQEELIERKINIELCHQIFNWVAGDSYNQLSSEIHKGEENETIKI